MGSPVTPQRISKSVIIVNEGCVGLLEDNERGRREVQWYQEEIKGRHEIGREGGGE